MTNHLTRTLSTTLMLALAFLLSASPAAADFVINDDLIVDGSACIGFDCVNGEVFSFDTIRLKENNLRIKFDDTSVAASFPRNDWQLTANDSANGGLSKFSIEDISGGRTPFTVEANAPNHSLYVDDGGRIGSGTSTPSVEFHIVDGDTPTLRLQQDSSSGFQPQTWDVAGNETNFFVRDVTNGSTLPFRIRPGAPSSSVFIDVDGDVGIGTASPSASLNVVRTNGSAKIVVDENSSTIERRSLLLLENNGEVSFDLARSDTSFNWQFLNNNTFAVNLTTGDPDGGTEMFLTGSGDMTVQGDYFSTTCTAGNPCAPDYVFQPDYELESIEEHATSMWQNSYLPAVGAGQHKVALTKLSYGMLEELEKAHIYIERLNDKLKGVEAANKELQAKAAEVDELTERLARLEQMLTAQQ